MVSLLLFLRFDNYKWNFIASFILGISIIIKPTSAFLIPFLILFQFDLESKKLKIDFGKSLIRLIGVLIPVSLNFILFFLYPKLWHGFLETNFTGNNPVALNFSYSISKLFTNFSFMNNIPFNQLIVLITFVGIIGGLGFIIYVIRRDIKPSLLYGYTFGLIIMLLAYFDSWNHHLLNLTPLLIIILFNIPRSSEITRNYIKPSFFFFNFFDLIFLGLWYLTYPLFPYNFGSTIFLILLYMGISIYCLKQERTIKFE